MSRWPPNSLVYALGLLAACRACTLRARACVFPPRAAMAAPGGTFELVGAAVGDVARHEQLLEEFERRARARAQAVPTAVADVKV